MHNTTLLACRLEVGQMSDGLLVSLFSQEKNKAQQVGGDGSGHRRLEDGRELRVAMKGSTTHCWGSTHQRQSRLSLLPLLRGRQQLCVTGG